MLRIPCLALIARSLLWLPLLYAWPGHAASDAPRTLRDVTGHVLTLPAEPRRLGTPGISMVSLIVALGGKDALSAITPEVRANPWLHRVLPRVAQLPTPFSRPAGVNLEALLASQVNLAVLWGPSEALTRKLEAVGVSVVHLDYATAAQFIRNVQVLGQAMGRQPGQRADALIAYYTANRQRVAQALRGLPDSARPRVYYASIAPLHTEGGDTLVDAWIHEAGGVNVATADGLRGDGQVNLEDVLRWNPDTIITLYPEQKRRILEDARWKTVAAVRAGRVFVCPGGVNAWCTRAAEATMQVLWAAKTLHPERLTEVDIGQEARRFYQQFYDYPLSAGELALILRGEAPPAGR